MAATLPRSPAEQLRARRLVVNKRQATGLLAAITVVFVATIVAGADDGVLGYVQATAEASMVGGLADWFAVVALFRHPLGIPIPHTAIIPERKDQFGETLGDFVQTSFLTPEAITERVRAAGVGNRIANWLARPANADRLAHHLIDAAVTAADLVKDEDVHGALEQFVRDRIENIPLAPVAGRALRFATEDGRHQEVVEAAIRGIDRYLLEHQDDLHARFGQRSPWWLPGAVEDRIFDRLVEGAHNLLQQMADSPNHPIRRALDERLQGLAHELETSPELRARGEQLKRDLLDQPALREWVATIWTDVKAALREQADATDSELRQRLAAALAAGGERLRDDPVLRLRLSDAVETGARYVAIQFHGEIGELVSSTIARWDGAETSRRLELLLGPDLQFIRINGTVVGGLAGLLLHTIAQAAA